MYGVYALYSTAKIEEVECKILRYMYNETPISKKRILLQKGFHPIVCLLRRE